jgi:alkane 1-monooxygenase
LYGYLARQPAQAFAASWRIEARRLHQRGRGPWHPSNRVLRGLGAFFAGFLAAAAFGSSILLFHAIVVIVAQLVLLTLEYVQHYGLVRKADQAIATDHAWTTTHLSNHLTFNLGLHADHHLASTRPGFHLQTDGAAQMPFGYPAALLLAAIPPMWFRTMDSRLDTLAR